MRPLVLLFLASLVGCGGCPPQNNKPHTTCTLVDGSEIQVGESGSAGDCNTCVCTSALALNCTERACDDAGPAVIDAGTAGPDDGGVLDGGADAGVDEGPCHDNDHDGYYNCIDPNHPERSQLVDCDDERFHVQPGGIEFPDTPEDDNCDGSNTDFTTCECNGLTAAADIGNAMDLCGDSVVSATKSGDAIQFGNVDSYRGVIDPRRRPRSPTEPLVILGNTCLASISSGDATGTRTDVEASSCNFGDPDPAGPQAGTEICDLAQIHFTLHAPPNAQGFAFDFMFMSQEWPEYLCLIFNDTFYAIVNNDQAVHHGAPTNAAFDLAGRPVTVNVGFFENPAQWTVPLDGTPYGTGTSSGGCPTPGPPPYQPGCVEPSYCNDPNLDTRAGSGSGWLTTTVPVKPGQDFELTMSIHDEGDQIVDSLALMDAFRWLPFEPPLATGKEQR